MQAQLIDAIRALQYIMILINRDPKRKAPDPPAPYPIPDVEVRKRARREPEPGSFAFIAKRHIEQLRKQKEAGSTCPEEQAAKK